MNNSPHLSQEKSPVYNFENYTTGKKISINLQCVHCLRVPHSKNIRKKSTHLYWPVVP